MRFQSKLIGSGAVLLALGGIGTATALAQTSGAATPVKRAPVAKATTPEPVVTPDTDNIQSGDQTTPDAPAAKAGPAAASTETANESESASESETSPSDGPGGYADPPGNVDTQQTGEN